MNKTQAFIISLLLLSGPGAYLAWVMISMFLNHAQDASMMLQITAGIASLCGVATALLPFGILLFMPSGPKVVKAKAVKAKKGKEQAAVADAEEAEVEDDDEEIIGESTFGEDVEMSDDMDEFEPDHENETMEFESDDVIDDFDMDDEPKPKKKR